jgi:hypothetical protein
MKNCIVLAFGRM